MENINLNFHSNTNSNNINNMTNLNILQAPTNPSTRLSLNINANEPSLRMTSPSINHETNNPL